MPHTWRSTVPQNDHQGAQRGDVPQDENKTTVEFFGSKYVLESALQDIKALSRFLVLKDGASLDQRRMSSIRKTTVQVDVDMDCSETFFVSDDRTRDVSVIRRAVLLRRVCVEKDVREGSRCSCLCVRLEISRPSGRCQQRLLRYIAASGHKGVGSCRRKRRMCEDPYL